MKHTIPSSQLTTLTAEGYVVPQAIERALRETMPARTAYWLSRIAQVVQAECKSYNETRLKLIQQLGEETAAGTWKVKPENMQKFADELATLAHDVELPLDADRKLALPETVNGEAWRAVLAVFSNLFEEPS